MKTIETVSALREFRGASARRGATVGFVPTMGALHAGHKSCIDLARGLSDVLVVSIFVNPTQFAAGEDLDTYPRSLEDDLARCEEWGVDVVFAPAAAEVYPGDPVWVEVGPLGEPLCGRTRKGHFRGVATVVARLFEIVEPQVAVFGQKDAQQALVVRQMVADLGLGVTLRLSPIVREGDGLAQSSRNVYLSAGERARATGIYKGLCYGRELVANGERDPAAVADGIRYRLEEEGIDNVEYVEVLDARDLGPLERLEGRVLTAIAATVGTTRLIDNMVLEVTDDGTTETLLF